MDTLLNVLLQVNQACVQQFLFVRSKLAHVVNLLHTIWTKSNLGREEVDTLVLVEWAVNEGWFDNIALTISSSEHALSHTSTSHSHGESSRASTILSLDNLVTTELNSVDQFVQLGTRNVAVTGLRDQWNNGDTGVATDDSDVLVGRVRLLDLGDESGGSDNIESGDTEESLGVVDTLALEDLTADWDCGVDLFLFINIDPFHMCYQLTGLEMTRTFAFGAASATALARSRTMLALVLKRSTSLVFCYSQEEKTYHHGSCLAFVAHQLGSRQPQHRSNTL